MAKASYDRTVKERSYQVLIVDDDVADQKMYGRLLAEMTIGKCDITYAADGVAGLAALQAADFDCLLLDYNLPDMTGFAFLDAAAGGCERPYAVVLITGQGSEFIAVEAMKRGVQDYLSKDWVNANSICRAVTAAVVQVELRQRLADSLRDLTHANTKLEAEVRNRKTAEMDLRAAKAEVDLLARHLAEARDRAEQANRAKSHFLAGMSHELRTPLNGILGYAHLLDIEGDLNVTQAARVNAMLGAGRHLLEMIACVLDLSEIENGKVTLHAMVVDPQAIVAACMDLVRPAAEAKGLALSLVVTDTAPQRLRVDPTRLRQVLLNLLGNAVKFTSEGGVAVRLETLADGCTLRIDVTDTGPGIPADQRQRLFQDFDRLNTEVTTEGAGLGLALSSRIAALMGGRMGHDDNPRRGSVFWLELPLGAAATQQPNAPSNADLPDADFSDARAGQLTQLNVLVVDDVAMNRDIAACFLRAYGHDVTSLESGADAVAAAETTDFDCILMDVRMPDMDGLEATRRIRAFPGKRGRVPIVALTAQAFTDQIAECRKVGMDRHLAKPFDPESLLGVVASAVGAKP